MFYQVILVTILTIINSKLQQVVHIFRHGARYHLNA